MFHIINYYTQLKNIFSCKTFYSLKSWSLNVQFSPSITLETGKQQPKSHTKQQISNESAYKEFPMGLLKCTQSKKKLAWHFT